MASQKIVWTALPKGVQDGTMRLSVYVSPRLTPPGGSGKLGSFPDFWNPAKHHWPGLVRDRTFELEFRVGGGAKVAKGSFSDGTKFDADLWAALFSEKTLVKAFDYTDLSTRFIHSYPVRTVLEYVKGIYRTVAGSPTRFPRLAHLKDDMPIPDLHDLLGTLGPVASDERWQRKPWDPTRYVKDQKLKVLDPGKYNSYGFSSPEQMAFAEVNRFYDRPHAGNPYRESPDPGLAGVRHRLPVEKPDFHAMLSALADYPPLMRMLGIVIDLDVVIPPGESLGSLLAADAVRVKAASSQEYSPWTCMDKAFVPVPRGGSDIRDDMLRLDAGDLFEMVQVDADSVGLKTLQFAGSMERVAAAHSSSQPGVNYTVPNEASLPAVRTSGIGVARNNRAMVVAQRLVNSKQLDTALASNAPADLYADDLVRGYRVDVRESGEDWRSLCFRSGRYVLLGGSYPELNLNDEGYIKSASSTSTNDGIPTDDELYLHENLFQWDGWSLCASMPGRTIVPQTYDATGKPLVHQEEKVEKPANKAVEGVNMEVSTGPQPGTLPRLRYGRKYQMRARIVDLAGNSVPLKAPGSWKNADPEWIAMSAADHATQVMTYCRFEPVPSPALVPRVAYGEGESAERVVIRSNYDKTTAEYIAQDYVKKAIDGKWYAYAETSERHVVPPKTSQLAAETHSLLDEWIGKGKPHEKAYNISVKEAGTLLDTTIVDISTGAASLAADGIGIVTPAGTPAPHAVLPGTPAGPGEYVLDSGGRLAAGQYVVHNTSKLILPYLPDPFARGTAFRGLPKVDAPGTIAGGLHKVKLGPAYDGVVLKVPFEGGWPDAAPFRLQVVEGTGEPSWNAGERLLTVPVPKGRVARVIYSSYMGKDPKTSVPDYRLMGISTWSDDPDAKLGPFSETGGHWMLTPFRHLELVHAVQQPLKAPAFYKSQVRKWKIGDTFVNIYGFIDHDAQSTMKLEVAAEWFDPIDSLTADAPDDDPAPGGTERFNHRGVVFSTHVDDDAPDLLAIHCPDDDNIGLPQSYFKGFPGVELPAVQDGDASKLGVNPKESAVTKEITIEKTPAVEGSGLTLSKADPKLIGLEKAGDGSVKTGVAPGNAPWCRHEFHDTKHRFVNYRITATTRYREYFPEAIINDPANITRTGAPWKSVNILSSARPDAPKVLYVVPTFGWEEKKIGDELVSRRCGNGLRVYLDRPWYSSGIGELLGVVLQSQSNLSFGKFEGPLKPYLTDVGMDPIWGSEFTPSTLKISDFPLASHGQNGLTLDEIGGYQVGVAGHAVDFDKERQLWYADIEIDAADSYYPFVRLALARYQPDSIPDAHLSRVVITDFAQLAPDRIAAILFDPKDARKVVVAVSGPYGTSNHAPNATKYNTYLQGSSKDPMALAVQGMSRILQVTVETRIAGSPKDAPWLLLGGTAGTAILQPVEKSESKMIWQGELTLPEEARKPGGRQYRLVITELELLSADNGVQLPAFSDFKFEPIATRLVYADAIELQ